VVVGGVLALAGALSVNAALAADVERGRILYETRCNVCHATGVHIR
jgi:mono/diheme cytochrome c family protein